jgi:tetratricopeptide (TPR) repeat protein
MVAAVLLCCALVGQDPRPAPIAPADLEVYKSAQSKVGHDASAHVQLALWCEAHGLTSERIEQLAMAVMRDPHNAVARGLLGLVSYQGKWQSAVEVEKQVQKDEAYQKLVREYLDRRARTPERADAQLKLAAWCNEKGLKEQAQAHYSAVVRLDPSREIAWKHLGYKKYGNRWIKPADAAAERHEADHQRIANVHWKLRLENLHDGLLSTSATRRERAEQGLAEIDDPRAVPMIWNVLASGGERSQLAAVKVLERIEGAPASSALATLAVFSSSQTVRQLASTSLASRDPRDVIGQLINLIRRPFQYSVRPGSGPGSTGELFVDGERFNLRRLYQSPRIDVRLVPVTPASTDPRAAVTRVATANNGTVVTLPNGFTAVSAGMGTAVADQIRTMMETARVATLQRDLAVLRTLNEDIQTVENVNNQINQLNGRVLPILTSLTGQDLGVDPLSWQKWWTDQLGYVYQSSQPTSKPTYTETVYLPDIQLSVPIPGPDLQFPVPLSGGRHHSCFAAGTLVHTIDGPRTIESIRVGDRVLSQNTTTGLLAFEPVVATHLNAPSPTLRIGIDGETIVATGIHRFWKAGKGWVMARELKVGDRLRMIGGVVEIASIEPDTTQPVYNLDVAENVDFFVGTKGLLVHDFSFVQPVPAPFDRLPDLSGPAVPGPAR